MRILFVLLFCASACAVGASGDDEPPPEVDAQAAHDGAVDHAVADHASDHVTEASSMPDASTIADATPDVVPPLPDAEVPCMQTGCGLKESCCMIKTSPSYGKCFFTSCLACCQ